jgi:hypothetical protein
VDSCENNGRVMQLFILYFVLAISDDAFSLLVNANYLDLEAGIRKIKMATF